MHPIMRRDLISFRPRRFFHNQQDKRFRDNRQDRYFSKNWLHCYLTGN